MKKSMNHSYYTYIFLFVLMIVLTKYLFSLQFLPINLDVIVNILVVGAIAISVLFYINGDYLNTLIFNVNVLTVNVLFIYTNFFTEQFSGLTFDGYLSFLGLFTLLAILMTIPSKDNKLSKKKNGDKVIMVPLFSSATIVSDQGDQWKVIVFPILSLLIMVATTIILARFWPM